MLFSHMSLWAIALVLVLALVAKHFAIQWILKTNLALADTQGQGWVGALVTNGALNAVCDFVILYLFAGLWWSVAIAVADFVLHYLLGYWKKRHHLPPVNAHTVLNVYNAVSFLHTTSYVGIVAFVLKYVFPNNDAVKALSSLTGHS